VLEVNMEVLLIRAVRVATEIKKDAQIIKLTGAFLKKIDT